MKIYVQNLGKYNEGYIVGGWITLPKAKKEIDNFLRNVVCLQITQQEVEDSIKKYGKCYEEYIITDYESSLDYYGGEYESIYRLNLLASFEKEVNNFDVVNAYICNKNITDIHEICNVIAQQDELPITVTNFKNVYSDGETVAYWYVDNMGGIENIDKDTIFEYFDYEGFGQDISLTYYPSDDEMPETAGEYWCGDENASYSDIAEAYIDQLGFDSIVEPESYFDYELFGDSLIVGGIEVIYSNLCEQIILDTSADCIDVKYYSPEELEELEEL